MLKRILAVLALVASLFVALPSASPAQAVSSSLLFTGWRYASCSADGATARYGAQVMYVQQADADKTVTLVSADWSGPALVTSSLLPNQYRWKVRSTWYAWKTAPHQTQATVLAPATAGSAPKGQSGVTLQIKTYSGCVMTMSWTV